ncbi:hypothetical protein RUM43_005385 [Polyplax serrata]|uniref:Uncharacterized protein n=1 Tax=Polyplax serrata TaxID=468196 RepID=A0AAN8PDG7_POLSC
MARKNFSLALTGFFALILISLAAGQNLKTVQLVVRTEKKKIQFLFYVSHKKRSEKGTTRIGFYSIVNFKGNSPTPVFPCKSEKALTDATVRKQICRGILAIQNSQNRKKLSSVVSAVESGPEGKENEEKMGSLPKLEKAGAMGRKMKNNKWKLHIEISLLLE